MNVAIGIVGILIAIFGLFGVFASAMSDNITAGQRASARSGLIMLAGLILFVLAVANHFWKFF